MSVLKVVITGQAGFIGTHLYNTLKLDSKFSVIDFEDNFFQNQNKLEEIVKDVDVVVHLAAMNRHEDPQVIYDTNLLLVNQLISSCDNTASKPHILFSSSSQESRDNLYGDSKLIGRELLEAWARKNNAIFTGMVIPNVFGPFGRPNYNSVVATFCHKVANNESPEIHVDSEVKLIYVNKLVNTIITKIKNKESGPSSVERFVVPNQYNVKVSRILQLINSFKTDYLGNGVFPDLSDSFNKDLFNTFRTYVNENHFPFFIEKHTDNRGSFVEIARTNSAGQFSFSTTVPGITRGNHYHTRKAERFAVIKGKARIQLRKIGTNDIINYYLDGEKPSFVDMPIWTTHNITNVGEDELVTLFWINEPYNQLDPDTYFEEV